MNNTAFNYEGIPKNQNDQKNKFLLDYLILLLVSFVGILYQSVLVALIPLAICLFLRIYQILVSSGCMHTFAKANNLKIYDYPKLKFYELPFFNKIYKVASVSSGILIQPGPPLVEVFTYTTAPLWRSAEFQVVHIKLSHVFPNTIIDGRSNDYLLVSDLPVSFKDITDQYTLEGDFSKYFRVYADAEKSIETLQLLSPDLMATLVDNFSDSNIEFINSSIFITTRTKYVSRGNFKQLMESSLKLSHQLERKSRKTLRVAGVYEERISKH